MNVASALAVWSEACSETDVRWFLYRETLLCAAGYHQFPEALPFPQVAVFGEELSVITQQVFPRLPEDWTLNRAHLGRSKHNLIFYKENIPVLELCVLYGTQSEAQAAAFDSQVRQTYKKVRTWSLWNKIGRIIPLYPKTLGKLVKRKIRRLREKAFPKVLALAGTSLRDADLYWDSLTSKKPSLLPGSWFQDTQNLPCDGIDYPVFAGYREYLTMIFGDYEAGLFDEIGCGLTAEDKEALKAHQARSFEALTFLREISREFGLRFYLLAGSVLGCVRHGGFIPWDDDIDVGIRIDELERFEQIVKEQLPKRLPEGFTLMQSGPNNPYPRMFSKICFDGRCCIDLWPLVPTYRDGFRGKLLWYFGKIITKVHYLKIGHEVTKFRKLSAALGFFLTDRMVMALARYNEKKYVRRNTPSYINLYSIYRRPKETIQRVWLDTEATGNFQGLEVPVVGCTEDYLTHLYGDYMAKPAPWNRASRHFARFYPTNSNN